MGSFKKDLTHSKFGRLFVVRYAGGGKWECLCDCEKTVYVDSNSLTSGNTKSCGCLNNDLIHHKRRNSKDLTHKRYGYLEVLEYVDSNNNGTMWRCKCHNCGSITVVNAAHLKKYKSCGCLEKEASQANISAYRKVVKDTKTNPGRFLNDAPNKNNKTGIKGVCYLESTGTYVAYITFQGVRKTLKKSKNFEEAVKARKEAEAHLGDFLEWYEEYKKKCKDDKK